MSSLVRLRRATLWLVASFAVIVLGAGTYHLAGQYRDAVENAFRSARATALTAESHAARTFGETFKVVEGIADVYRLERERGVIDESILHKVLSDKLAGMPYIATFLILDPQGHPIAGSRAFPMDRTRSLFDQSPVQPPSSNDHTFVGKLYQAKRFGPDGPTEMQEWYLPLGVRVQNSAGETEALILAVIHPSYFATFYRTLDVGPMGRVTMWTQDGYLVAATNNEATPTGQFNSGIKQFAEQLSARSLGADTLVYAARFGYTREVNAHGQIDGLPFIVSTHLSGEDYLKPWRQTRNRIAVGMLAIILTMVAFAVIILNQLDRTRENEEALRLAKAFAEEANDAKSRFLAHMSHEFRTPLNAIMGFSDIIKSKVMGDPIAPIYTTYAEHIHRSGEHLLNIVNDILDMAKIESGAQSMQQHAMDMAAVVRSAVSFVEGLAGQFELHVKTDIAGRLPQVTGDERFVRQVLINLLSNAIKFSSSGGTVVVRVAVAPQGALDVAVVDHGPGIEPMILKRIGEPFLQGNPSLSRAGQGTGLGLSICKHYMELLGGELIIESTQGSGTTAIMRFPTALLIQDAAVA